MAQQHNQHKFEELRKAYPTFFYNDFSYTLEEDGLHITFDFSVGEKFRFHPTLFFPKRPFYQPFFENNSLESLKNIVFHLGLIELVSYWKATCSPVVCIKPYALSEEQQRFWTKLYYLGLGEFFFLNDIHTSQQDFMHIQCTSTEQLQSSRFQTTDSYIIPIGGGKDSVVTLELLRNQNNSNLPLIINPRGATLQSAAIAGFQSNDFIEIKRTINPELLQLNKEGFLNGHTPFSAMLAFNCLLAGVLTGKRYAALSNEASANEATIVGSNINHQYSKSYEFENDFRNYAKRFITPDVVYFSFLRPLSELQIAKLFAMHPQYFPVFKSCNAGSKTDSWCGNCPKCLFTYIILSPFVAPETLVRIFGKNLFDDANLRHTLDELLGNTSEKPFECVGTIDEVNLAMCAAIKKYDHLPVLLQHYVNTDKYSQYKDIPMASLLHSFDQRHFLSESLMQLLMQELQQN